MTAAANGFPRRDHAELGRWSTCLAFVLVAHVAAGLYLLWRQVPRDAGGQPLAAVMIDLAPLPAPTAPLPATAIEPVVQPQPQPIVQPPPPLPLEPDIPLPQPDPSPAPKPAVVMPKSPSKAKPRPVEHPPQAAPERPPPAAAPAVSAPPAPTAAPAMNSGATRARWEAQLVGWLERYKRYPRLAQELHQQGVVYLQFALDRQGRVLSAQIDKGSGFSLLDEEVLALVQRAQPFPAPPPEVPGTRIELTVPVQFSIRQGAR